MASLSLGLFSINRRYLLDLAFPALFLDNDNRLSILFVPN